MNIGHFEVLATLGKGALGTVYRARHAIHGRIAAIKQLDAAVAEDSPEWSRLLAETGRLTGVTSTHVVRVFSCELVDGRPVIEMESLGESLDRRMRQSELSLVAALSAIRDVLAGLKDLHAAGVVHGNVKPANILQDTTTGSWKLSDGGLTPIEGQTIPTLLATSLLYIAPETVSATPRRDHRSDLYSIGMVGFEALLGTRGLNAAFAELAPVTVSPSRWLAWLDDRGKEPRALQVVRPETPQPVSDFVARLLAKDPDRRYASADEALDALTPLLNLADAAPAVRPSDGPVSAPPVAAGNPGATRLIIKGPAGFEQQVELSNRALRIGRDSQNDIVLPDDTKAVSRVHAELKVEQGRYVLVDLGSQNGLRVNGKKKTQVTLGAGMAVGIGGYVLSLAEPSLKSPVAVPPVKSGAAPIKSAGKVARPPRLAPIGAGGKTLSQYWKIAAAAAAIVVTATVAAFVFLGGGPPVVIPPQDTGAVTPTPTPTVSIEPPTETPTPAAEATPTPSRNPTSRGTGAGPALPDPIVRQRPGESEPAWRERDRVTADRYSRATKASNDANWSEAVRLWSELNRDEPDYLDVRGQLVRAQEGLNNAFRQTHNEGSRFEKDGALVQALQRYQRARVLDPSSSAAANDYDRVFNRMIKEGTEAFADAQLAFSYGESQYARAAVLYQKAYDYLPDSDPNRKIAKERLDKIRKQSRIMSAMREVPVGAL